MISPSPAALAWAAKAPAVVALDDLTALRVAQPSALRIFRRYLPYQDLHADPASLAHQIVDGLGGYRHPRLYCQVYVGVSKDVTPLYIALMRQVVPLLHEAGVLVAGPSQYSGDFDAATWAAWRAVGWAGIDLNVVQGYWASKGPTIWNALRYRQFWKPGDPAIFLGECGRDRVRDGDHGEYIGSPGWKSQGISGVDYVTELLAFDREVQTDPYVWGAAVFSAGTQGGEWRDFDTDGLNVAVLHTPPYIPGGETVASDYTPATWRPVLNYGYPTGAAGRQSHAPVGICFHIMAGYLVNCFTQFNNPASGASAHYGIGKGGLVEQYVREADAAWGAGQWNNPNLANRFLADAFAHNVNPNLILVNVELEGFPGDVMPEAQYQALLALTRSIFARQNWPATDAERFIGHYQIDSVNRPNDPGSGFNWNRLRADVANKPSVDLRPEVARAEALAAAMVQLAQDLRAKVGT